MCNDHERESESASRRALQLSRRDFSLAAFTAAAVALLPGIAIARDLRRATVAVTTADGPADGYFVHPSNGRHPGVLLWPDLMGLRPAYTGLADKLAQSGYAVLVINQFHRSGKAPFVDVVDFDDASVMQTMRSHASLLDPRAVTSDAAGCIGFLDAQAAVDPDRRIGTLGYCMGGGFAFRTAAVVPARVGAIASFHGGGLASDAPDSPHRLLPNIQARALIAVAKPDDERQPGERPRLAEAFRQAKLDAEIEVYDAPHGWCTPDLTGLYHPAEAKRAWTRLLALFERALV